MLDLAENVKAQERRISGVVVGVVTNNKDPDGMGRVKIRFPWRDDADESPWARIATVMAGPDRGIYFLPEVDDEVLVAFDHGEFHHPYVVGALWNGQEKPPETNSDGKNNIRKIKSRSGHLITLDDTDGSEKISIIDKSGKNSIVIDTKENTITLTADKDIVLKAPQGKISLSSKEIEMKTTAAVKVEAGSEMNLKASATMTVKGATVNIN